MHREPETYAQKMDRLANAQRIEDIDRVRRKVRRKEWWNTYVGEAIQYLLLGCLVVVVIGFLVVIL